MSTRFVVLFMGLLLSVQPVATDVNLASFPAIAQALQTNVLQIQLTFSAMLLAFGASQLVLGPLSDRFGRRPVLLWGMAAFACTGFVASLTSDTTLLIGVRVLQGIALGTAVMCARAMVRDVYAPQDAAVALSTAFSILGATAMGCALVGAAIAQYFSWRLSFVVMGLYGVLMWYLTYRRFEETLTRPNPQALRLRHIVTVWRQFWTHPAFWTYCTLSTLTYLALFCFLSCSAFVLIRSLGVSRLEYGAVMVLMPLFYIGGTMYHRHLLRKMTLQASAKSGSWLAVLAGVVMLALYHATPLYPALMHPLSLVIPFYIFMLSHGVMQSSGQVGVVANFAHAAGAAAAMNGFVMMLASFVMSLWLGAHADLSFALVHGLGFSSLLVAAVAWFAVPRFGKLPDV